MKSREREQVVSSPFSQLGVVGDDSGDGFDDDVDQCPVEGLPDVGAGEILDGDGCIVFP